MVNCLHSDVIVEDLVKLGLTLNEAKSYKALVILGSSTAREIAEKSNIPRSKVYETLTLLEKRGIIQRLVGRKPAAFKALAPSTAVRYLLEKIEASSKTILTALEHIESERVAAQEEFVWTTQGDEQITLGIIQAFDYAKKSIFIATRLSSLISPLRSALSRAKSRGVVTEIHTTDDLVDNFNEFKYYAEIHSAIPSSEILVENLGNVLRDIDLESIGWNPDAMSIMVIDGTKSVAVFMPANENQKPWALHINNPLIVLIQWQVIRTALYTIGELIRSASQNKNH